MTSAHEPVTSALLAALQGSGFAVGDHEAPVPTPDDRPYAILYAIPGGGTWGPPLVDHTESAQLVFQVNSIGQRRDQVQKLADRLRHLVLGRTGTGGYATALAPAGLAVIDRDLDSHSGVEKSDEVWTSIERYRLTVTPL